MPVVACVLAAVVAYGILYSDFWLLTPDFYFSMYSEKVLNHFNFPRNVGAIENATAVAEATNPVCGDELKLWVVVQSGKVVEARFKAAGCVPAVACGSWLAEWIAGKNLSDLPPLTPEQIERALDGLPQASAHASVLAADVLKRLLAQVK